jgi:hypothetical protein
MGVVLSPILEGKVDAWKQWSKELMGPSKEALKDFNRRYGLTRHAAWLAQTPSGPVVVALQEGAGGADFMPKLVTSQHKFDVLFKNKLLEIHGFDLSKPLPGPLPELFVDSGS